MKNLNEKLDKLLGSKNSLPKPLQQLIDELSSFKTNVQEYFNKSLEEFIDKMQKEIRRKTFPVTIIEDELQPEKLKGLITKKQFALISKLFNQEEFLKLLPQDLLERDYSLIEYKMEKIQEDIN